MNSNTVELIEIEKKLISLGFYEKYPNIDFSYEVAKRTGELGRKYPSNKAIRLARKWFKEFKSTREIKDLKGEKNERGDS